jgi:EKC/KEOPS complex subunit CGI121/TPRKB
VENASSLRQRIIKAATMQGRKGEIEREAVNFAFIDARLVGIHSSIHCVPFIEESLAFSYVSHCDYPLGFVQITSPKHLLTAVHQAILADSTNPSGLRTKSVHSEVLFYLNPTNNVSFKPYHHLLSPTPPPPQITEAFRNYGLSDTSTSLVVVRIGSPNTPDNAIQEMMKDVVIGDIVEPFEDELGRITDWSLVKRVGVLGVPLALLGAYLSSWGT